MANDEKSRNADFVGKVVGDAKNPPETRLLSGWFGDSGEEGYRRLYTDAELTSYVDIPTDAILHTEPIRDVQPAGGVLVWVKADAALKQGGTAASRAARFLQGQVQQDFSSPEKAGYRCVTQPPCGEPTGFTGQCTKQPEVGGGWPCITAIPHCAEPTGFTGKCTEQPWPNPTQYAGCTVYHCPTQDLTHVPWICQAVAGADQQQAAAPQAQRAAGDDAAAIPPTNIPGCGYTKSWGLCETQLLGCGFTKDWGPNCPPAPDTNIPGCGWSKNPICTDLPGCGWTKDWGLCNAQQRQPQNFAFEGGGGGGGGQVGAATSAPWCVVAQTVNGPQCLQIQTPQVQCLQLPTRQLWCFQTRFEPHCWKVTPWPPRFDPRAGLGGGGGFAQFGAAAGGGGQARAVVDTQVLQCNPSWVDACPTRIRGCETVPPTELCTQIPEGCPTWCGPNCQSQAPCTPVNCTQAGPNCPDRTVGIGCTLAPPCIGNTNDCTFGCTQVGTGCPQTPIPNCAINDPNVNAQQFGAPQAAGGGFQITLLTIPVWNCVAPTPATRCFICPPKPSPWFCTPPISIGIACTIVQCGPGGGGGGGASAVDACPSRFCPPGGGGGEQFFGAQAQGPIGPTGWQGCTQFGQQCRSAVDACPTRLCGGGGGGQTAATVCTQFGQQCASAVDACPTRLCGGGGVEQFGAARPAAGAGGGFGTTAWLDCTQFGPQCGQFFTLFEVECQVIDPWATRIGPQCFTLPPQCPRTVVGCPPPPPPTPFCPPPTPLCPPQSRFIACTVFGPQCGGGGTIVRDFVGAPQQEQFGAAPAAGRLTISSFNCPTPATFCFWCPPATFAGDCGTFAQAGGQQFGAPAGGVAAIPRTPFCPPTPFCPQPSPIFRCPPSPLCPRSLPVACPPSPFGPCEFTTAVGCPPPITAPPGCGVGPSAVDACPTRFCPPGGGRGGEQLVGAPIGGPAGGYSFLAYRCYTFFNPCPTINIDCWFENYWNFRLS